MRILAFPSSDITKIGRWNIANDNWMHGRIEICCSLCVSGWRKAVVCAGGQCWGGFHDSRAGWSDKAFVEGRRSAGLFLSIQRVPAQWFCSIVGIFVFLYPYKPQFCFPISRICPLLHLTPHPNQVWSNKVQSDESPHRKKREITTEISLIFQSESKRKLQHLW